MSAKHLYFIDSGRALASILGIPFHMGLVFSYPWIVNVDEENFSKSIYYFTMFGDTFRMPLFLFIAGYFSAYSLKKYGKSGFIRNRAKRLGLPLIVSMVTLLQVEGFVYLYGQNWNTISSILFNPFSHAFSLSHLWFLYFLLIYSILLLGMESLRNVIINKNFFTIIFANIHKKFDSLILFWILLNGSIYFFALEVSKYFPIHQAWFPIDVLGEFFPYYLFGCYCFTHQRFLDLVTAVTLKRLIVLSLHVILLYMIFISIDSFQVTKMVIISFRWIFTTAVLGLLFRFLNFSHPTLKYLSDASYPVYLFHHPLVVIFATLYIKSKIQLPVPIAFSILLLATTLSTYLAYEFIVRRNKIGMLFFTGRNRFDFQARRTMATHIRINLVGNV